LDRLEKEVRKESGSGDRDNDNQNHNGLRNFQEHVCGV
jgi:hypothetical protein